MLVRIRPLPKTWLIHSIVYEQYTDETDDFGNPSYAAPVTIEHVRFDESTVFSRDNTQTKVQANGVIFVDAVHSVPSVTFKEQSQITFGERELVIVKVVPCYHPQSNEIHHWELEII